jgi:hypothetical protein
MSFGGNNVRTLLVCGASARDWRSLLPPLALSPAIMII